MVARAIAPQSDLANQNVIDQLNALEALDVPVGWRIEDFKDFSNGGLPWVLSGLDLIVGWLITAVATLFGAPFWFDALQQTIRLKGTGPSPVEKKANTGAAASSNCRRDLALLIFYSLRYQMIQPIASFAARA
jgi:hypothetical protein